MLHTAHASSSSFTDGFVAARSETAALRHDIAALPVHVSALGDPALREAKPQLAAVTTASAFEASPQSFMAGQYGAEIATMALGLIGAWMVLLGLAMLARAGRSQR